MSQRPTVLLTRLFNALWEYRLGIRSHGVVWRETRSDFNHYSTVSYPAINAILRNLSLKSSDVFVDIGCGKGRVICCAARFKIREAIGIEIDKELCSIAEWNAERLCKRKREISLLNISAEDFDYDKGSVFYFFNPFGAITLHNCLEKLNESHMKRPREMRIVYVNPIHESLLDGYALWKMYDKWAAGTKFGLDNDVSFWKVDDGADG